jgi:pimeloyl-ACP methyl ester carboxylesterase
VSIWHDESGHAEGPLIALIHGTMDRSSGMLKLSRLLDHRALVLRYDRRGYGKSAPHPGPFSIDHQVADLVALLGGRRAVLVGHSYGGNVALATAARHPHLVSAVAVYETPLSWEPWWPGTTAGARALATSGDPAEAAEGFMRRMIGDDRWNALPERTRLTRRQEGSALLGELADIGDGAPWTPDQITQRVLAGFGSGGRPHHRRGMEQVAATFANAAAVELVGCGHDAPMHRPALFTELLIDPLLGSASPD